MDIELPEINGESLKRQLNESDIGPADSTPDENATKKPRVDNRLKGLATIKSE
jgi:hypothetical protein